MRSTSIGFIGGGRITKIFLQAFQNKKVVLENVKVFDPNSETLSALKNVFPEVEPVQSAQEAATQKIVVLAVHPPVMTETLAAIKEVVSAETTVLSLAPKVTIEKICGALGIGKVVRMIPNATSYINEGYNPVAFADGFDKKEKKQLLKLLKKLGKTFETEESKLEGYAIVSAMLPTYFWFQWQEMENIGIKTGLLEKEAYIAVSSTLKKAWKLYYKSGLTPEEVMDLIPAKPIGKNETEIRNILNEKLIGLFEKIKP